MQYILYVNAAHWFQGKHALAWYTCLMFNYIKSLTIKVERTTLALEENLISIVNKQKSEFYCQ